jgi:Leucine-rich repeat (LRR) protein
LTRIPPCIGQLTNLAELDLRVNEISEIPLFIKNLKKLEKLLLSGNDLSAEKNFLMELDIKRLQI